MKSFGFKQLRRKEGPSFYLKGFQRSKCQWGRAKVRVETGSQGSLSAVRGPHAPFSEGAMSQKDFGGSLYDDESEGGDEEDEYDGEINEEDEEGA